MIKKVFLKPELPQEDSEISPKASEAEVDRES
jgi:hypothetical protein